MPNPVFLYSAQIVAILSVLLLAAGYLKTDPRASICFDGIASRKKGFDIEQH
jgi:hypothetical protein